MRQAAGKPVALAGSHPLLAARSASSSACSGRRRPCRAEASALRAAPPALEPQVQLVIVVPSLLVA